MCEGWFLVSSHCCIRIPFHVAEPIKTSGGRRYIQKRRLRVNAHMSKPPLSVTLASYKSYNAFHLIVHLASV
jgi:hypothetical protein